MPKIVVGLFDQIEHARMAVEELVQNGFRREDISLIAADASGEYKRYFGEHERAEDISEGAASGAGIGAVLGGLGGLLVGLGLLAIPGVGPILAAGPIATALAGAGIGAAAGGLAGALINAGIPEEQAELYSEGIRRGGTLVTVSTSDDMASTAIDILNRHHPVDVERRRSEWGATGSWSGQQREMSTPDLTDTRARADVRSEGETTLPVIEEELRVGKREVEEGGVRVHTRVEETPVEENVRLREERVDVERRPVDRPASPHDLDTFREGTIEMTERREEAVVDKQARVVEEVHLRKDVEEREETIRDTVRRTDVEVEGMGREGRTTTSMDDFNNYDTFFRDHFTTTYSGRNYTYDQYRPYYEYGYGLGRDERYNNRRWDEIEMEARRSWERDHPDTLWDDIRDAVRAGWERMTTRW